MNTWPKDQDAALDAFYSRPPVPVTAKWEVQNLVYIFPPWKIYIPETSTELQRGVRVHKKVAESLASIFNELWEIFGKSQAAIEKEDLHKIGGTYAPRPRRGSARLSNHARGIAIDIDPIDNPMHKGSRGDISTKVIDVFVRHGWRWGGVYGDPMHFEAVDNGGFKPFATYVPPPPYTDSEAEINAWVDMQFPKSKAEEDFRATRYWDLKHWSIGYGSNADSLPAETIWTEPQAADHLRARLKVTAVAVAKAVAVKLTTGQGTALLSFSDNLGVGNLQVSTLLKRLNAGDYAGAAGQFQFWVKGEIKGVRQVLPGLVKRREREKQLFLTP